MFAIAVSCNLLYQLLSQLYINCCYFFGVCFKTLHDWIYIAKRCGVIGHMKITQMAAHIMKPLCMSFSQWKKTDIFTLNLTMWINSIGSNRIHWQHCFKELHSFCFINILQWKCVIRLQKWFFLRSLKNMRTIASQWEPNFALWTVKYCKGILFVITNQWKSQTTQPNSLFERETDRNNCPDEQYFEVEHPKKGQSNPFSLVLQIQGRAKCCFNMAPSLKLCIMFLIHKYIGKITRDLDIESLTCFNTFSVCSIESMHM